MLKHQNSTINPVSYIGYKSLPISDNCLKCVFIPNIVTFKNMKSVYSLML